MTHLDLDALADLLAGEGTDAQVDHVGACATCAAALADLDAALVPVAAELAALAASPVPAPPADLEERLRALLPPAPDHLQAGTRPAAEAVAEADADADAQVVPLARPVPHRGAGLRGPGLLGAAAGVVGLLLAGVLGLGLLRTGAPESQDVAGGGSAGSAGGGQESGADSGLRVLATGTDYRPEPAALAAAVARLLGPSPGPLLSTGGPGAGPTTASSSAADPLARLRDPDALAACLAALPQAGGPPLAVDHARLAGRPALLVVLPTARPGRVEVRVVGPGCRASDPALLRAAVVDLPAG